MLALAREAMRTRWEIVLADDSDPARLRAAGEEALDEIERVEEQLSAYRPGSDLWEVNERGGEGPVRVAPTFLRFLERALELHQGTGGAFDLTIGPLLSCWGFIGGDGAVPSEADIAAARGLVGMGSHLLLDADAGTVRFSQPGVRLDPGAIGKGYALERALDLLREAGVASALLHGGASTIGTIGAPPDQAGWRVAVQHPLRPTVRLAEVSLRDRALSVSAVHGKSFRAEGRRFGHVLDPRTGEPVQGNILAAVAAASPTATDALSTGLLVSGAAGLRLLARNYPDTDLLIAGEGAGADSDLQITVVGDAFRGISPITIPTQ